MLIPVHSRKQTIYTMAPAFITATPLVTARTTAVRPTASSKPASINMQVPAADVAESFYPLYRRNRAPTIVVKGEDAVSISMAPIEAFADVDITTPPLLDYSDPDEFVPDIPVPPSAISWPAGDGRGNECNGTKGSFDQADLKKYGPFPDFFKVRFFSFFFCISLFLRYLFCLFFTSCGFHFLLIFFIFSLVLCANMLAAILCLLP